MRLTCSLASTAAFTLPVRDYIRDLETRADPAWRSRRISIFEARMVEAS